MLTEFLQQVLGSEWENSLIIVFNLIIIESLLSVDNAAVIATMVLDLPAEKRKQALRYGILGAYFFRGICMIFAYQLIKIWWLKPLGGIYLVYLAVDYFYRNRTPDPTDDKPNKHNTWYYKLTVGLIGSFWATVVAVEFVDLTFSLDNVFAAVAFSDNIYLICTGVFIGILAMRFVAQWFVVLLDRYPFLEISAFIVIGVLGLKMITTTMCHFGYWKILESETADILTSVLTVSCFFAPVIIFEAEKWTTKKKDS